MHSIPMQGREHMNIEISDETICEIIKQELLELHKHCVDDLYGAEDPDALQNALSLVLKQYMIPSEYNMWVELQ